jgi:hypothetical protein
MARMRTTKESEIARPSAVPPRADADARAARAGFA